MRAALNNARCGDKGQLRFLLQLGDCERAAVAHGGLYLAQRERDIVLEAAGIGDIGVNALLERQLLVAAEVIALPVPCAVGALAPVLFVVSALE